MSNQLSKYIHQFTTLRRDYKNGGAPHKPVLLLSIIQLFEKEIYNSNEIRLLPELVAVFKSTWNQLVTTEHYSNFSMPFYHLSSANFWTLIPNEGCEVWINSKTSMRSFNNLKIAVNYALIDKELAILLKDGSTRDILKVCLLEKYFPKTNHVYNDDLTIFPSENIIYENSEEYQKQVITLKKQLKDDDFQEELFVRSGLFKREITKIYNNTCAISGLRVDALADISMLDACHIVPFSESYNDSITNGIALCPNLHRAFDRGLITISNDYKVIVSNQFKEASNSSYTISQFNNNKILLPNDQKLYPSLKGFSQHRDKFGF
tara:strand:- start:1225 stop:2184 length:960 start_codon:yes stop_codon:yes gene_type:complete